MNKSVIVGIVVVIVAVGGFAIFHMNSNKTPTSTSSTTSSTTSSKPASTSSSSTTPAGSSSSSSSPINVKISANDTSSSPEAITAKQGQTVNITFAVSTNGTYHGGLDFKSTDPAIDSGSIAEGSSKTVSFTATKSFKFTPYWYQSNVQKDYFVTVNVD